MATYSALRISTTATTAVSTKSSGTITVASVASGQNYDCSTVRVDDTNETLTGTLADGSGEVTFEAEAALTVTLQS